MSLKDKLMDDLKDAMKQKDTLRKDTIQIIRAGVLQIEKDKKVVLDDSGVLDVVSRELKKRYDVMPDYEKSGRQDLLEKIGAEINLLKAYLPAQLTHDEVEDIVLDAIDKVGASSMKDMGKVMAMVSPELKGRADNKLVSEIVKANLNK